MLSAARGAQAGRAAWLAAILIATLCAGSSGTGVVGAETKDQKNQRVAVSRKAQPSGETAAAGAGAGSGAGEQADPNRRSQRAGPHRPVGSEAPRAEAQSTLLARPAEPPTVTAPAATPVLLGDTISGEIAYKGEIDSYGITVGAGTSVAVDVLSVSSQSDFRWRILNQYGREVLVSPGIFRDAGPAPLVGGDYRLEVLGLGATTGTYSLIVVDATPETTAIAVGDAFSGEIDVPGDQDRFTFTATPGQEVFLDYIAGVNNSALNWRIEDAYGRYVLDTVAALVDRGPIRLLGGAYTIVVLGETSGQGVMQTGSYQAQLVGVVHDTAAIAIGDPVSGAIDHPGQTDEYQFTAAPGARIAVDVTASSNPGGLSWQLDDAHGRSVVSLTSNFTDVGPIDLMGGDYTLTVSGPITGSNVAQTGTYAFTIHDVTETTTPISIGSPVPGSIAGAGDSNRYTFTAAAGQRIFLHRITASASSALVWSLTDALGRQILAPGNAMNDAGPFRLLGGDYTLTVQGRFNGGVLNTGTYTFEILEVSDDSTPMAIGDSVSGAIDVGETDEWTFTAPPGQIVTLALTGTSNTAGLNWSLTDSFGRAILARTGNLTTQGPFTLLGGAYTVTIVGESPASGVQTGSYDFTLQDSGTDTSFIPTGTPILLEDVVSGSILAPATPARYLLTVPDGEKVFFDLQAGNNALRWSVIDPIGQALFGPVVAGSASQDQGPHTLAAGVYTIQMESVSAGTYNYQFRVWDVIDAAGAVAPGDTAGDTFATPGAVHEYLLTLTASTTVQLDIQTGSNSLRWSLFDSLGTPVFENLTANTSSDQGPLALAADGYRLSFDPVNDTVPAYFFAIFAVTDTSEPITLDQVVSGSPASPGGRSVFPVDIPDGQKVYADVQVQAGNLDWSLVDPAGQPVFGAVAMNSLTGSDRGPYVLAGGTYEVVIDSTLSSTQAYQFRIWATQDTTQAAPLGTQIASSIATAGATLTCEITVAADGDAIYLDNQLQSGNTFWKLYDPVGTEVFPSATLSPLATSDRGPYTLFAGTYRLEVTGNYSTLPSFAFTPWASTHTTEPLPLETPVTADLGTPGSTRSYTIAATEGQRLLFDLTAGAPGLTWSLIDPLGHSAGLIASEPTASPTADDQGPLWLEAGTHTLLLDGDYETTDSRSFIVRSIDADLVPVAFFVTPSVLVGGELGRTVNASWTVANQGGQPIAGPWSDSIVLSADGILGNADDILLAQFAQTGPLGVQETYARSETIAIPDSLALGGYLISLVVDAGDAVAENLTEGNNTASQGLVVDPDRASATAVQTLRTLGPVDVSVAMDAGEITYHDFPLDRTVDIQDIRYVSLEGVRWLYSGGGTVRLSGWLMDGPTEVVAIGFTFFSGNVGNLSQIIRFATDLTSAQIATLPSTTVNAIRFRIDATDGGASTNSLTATAATGDVLIHLASCEFAACGPHRKAEFPGLASVNATAGTTPWNEIPLPEPVPAHGLRYITGGGFLMTWNIWTTPRTTTEMQLILNDGSILTMDDWQSPSTLTAPTQNMVSGSHSLELTDAEMVALDGLWVTAFRWRTNATNGGVTVTPGCPQTSNYCDPPYPPLTLFFVYDFAACTGTQSATPIDLDPPDGTVFPADSTVVISGAVPVSDALGPAAAVLVDGEPADSLDASGRFFDVVTVAEGNNTYPIEVIRDGCGAMAVDHHLTGAADFVAPLLNMSDVSTSVSASYRNTTLHRLAQRLVMDVVACNSGSQDLKAPLRMVIDRVTEPSVTLASPDGYLPNGRSYVLLGDLGASGRLAPGQCAPPKKIAFFNPLGVRVLFDAIWESPLNSAPVIASAPPTVVRYGRIWAYTVMAADPDGDPVGYALAAAPAGMTIDPLTGEAAWTPAPADLGSHTITIAVTDGFGGRADQSFLLTVEDAAANAAPYFTSSPPTSSPVGAPYSYRAMAIDRDGDALTFALTAGPPGASIDPSSGLLSWGYTLPGDHSVQIDVVDGLGASARQGYTLTVGSASANPTLPRLFGSPASMAAVDQLYFYQPVAGNPDPGETLTFSLTAAPAGMAASPVNGRTDWTPTSAQIGVHAVTLQVSDGQGGVSSQSWSIEVFSALPNRPPVVVTTPSLETVVAEPYSYPAHALDPEAQAVVYSIVSPPSGMAIDPVTGLVTWTPASTGSFTVALQATDPLGAYGAQVYTLDVVPPNAAPIITSSPPAVTPFVGAVYHYDVEASDADGHEITFSLDSAPFGMNIHPQTGLISWQSNISQVGDSGVTVRAADRFGGSATQSFTVTVAPDLVVPTVALRLSSPQAGIGTQAQACVEATDDVGITRRTLLVDGDDTPLDILGCAILSRATPATLALRAEGADAGANVGFDEATLGFVDPSNGTRPSVDIASIVPPPGSTLSEPAAIYATITDDTPAFLTWEVRLAREGTGQYEVIGSGAGPVTNGVVANLDTTLLSNDSWSVQIEASDGVLTGGVEFLYSVVGDLKLGEFRISFTDMTVNLAGFPVTIVRTYDSLDTTQGDFGFGWRLGFAGNVVDSEPEAPGRDLTAYLKAGAFRTGSRVYVTRPDGRRVGFTFDPVPNGPLTVRARFTPDDGVTDTLEALAPSAGAGLWPIGGRYYDLVIPFNPTTYVLTTAEGVSYTLDEFDGVQRIENRLGDFLDFSPTGIVSSTGASMSFERDGAGRISRIFEPDDPVDPNTPGDVEYSYDAAGNLVGFLDQTDHLTEYSYTDPAHPNYLTRIEDPLHRPVIRSVYDADGRIVAQCGPDGDIVTLAGCAQFSYDAAGRVQTSFSARGFRTDWALDAMGRPVLERRWINATDYLDFSYAYDTAGNLVSRTLPSGSTWTFAYDSQGREVSRTDPGGRTWTRSYASCPNPSTVSEPTGATFVVERDERCVTTRTIDPLGGVTVFTYDASGRPASIVKPNGNAWSFSYDPATRQLNGVTDPRGQTDTLVVGGNGRLLSRTDPDGRTITWTYDAAGRVISESWNSAPAKTFNYVFDAAGQITSASDGESTLTYTYRPDGRMESATSASSGPTVTFTYDYDADGNLNSVVDSTGGATEFEYDALDRLIEIRQSGAGVDEKLVTQEYDEATGTITIRRYSDLAGTMPVASTEVEFECTGCPHRLQALRHLDPMGAPLHALAFTRDDSGAITRIVDAEGTHDYSYDGLGRLIAAAHPGGGPQVPENYSYDSVGNRLSSHLSATSTHGYQLGVCTGSGTCGDHIVSDDTYDYLHDGSGNMTRRTDRSTGDYTDYEWDHRRRLTRITDHAFGGAVVSDVQYRYDPANRRIRVDDNGLVTHHVYDGNHPVLVFDGALQLLQRRLYGGRTDHLLAQESSGTTLWALRDQVSTIRDLVDDSGAASGHAIYDSFGGRLTASGSAASFPIGFAGREQSTADGLVNLRAREYDPRLGRFLGRDPDWPFGYDYAENGPLHAKDPSGKTVAIEYGCLAGFGKSAALLVFKTFYGDVQKKAFDYALADQDPGNDWVQLFDFWGTWSGFVAESASLIGSKFHTACDIQISYDDDLSSAAGTASSLTLNYVFDVDMDDFLPYKVIGYFNDGFEIYFFYKDYTQ